MTAPSSSAAAWKVSPQGDAAVEAAQSRGEAVGEDAGPRDCAAAMLRLHRIGFDLTTATDLALAGYDVLGYLTCEAGVPAVTPPAKRIHDGPLIPARDVAAPASLARSPLGAS